MINYIYNQFQIIFFNVHFNSTKAQMFEFRLLGGGETRWDAVKINNSGFISVIPYLLHRSLNQGMGMEGGFFI